MNSNSGDSDKPAGTAGGETKLNPGDEGAPGTAGAGENVCPECQGKGRIGQQVCKNCGGTGVVIEGVGGG